MWPRVALIAAAARAVRRAQQRVLARRVRVRLVGMLVAKLNGDLARDIFQLAGGHRVGLP